MHQPAKTRIESIDALRGFALFGILIVNVFVFNVSYQHYREYYSQFSGYERMVDTWMVELFAGKFMFLFAFLFGLSCWLQFKKFPSIKEFQPYWYRRLFVLALFGLTHLLLFWSGDILLPYALLGFTLILLINKPPRVLLPLCLFFLFFPCFAFFLQIIIAPLPPPDITHYGLEKYIMVFSSGNYGEIFSLRMNEYLSFRNEKLIFYMPKELALFIAGLIAGKAGLLKWISEKPKKVWIVASGILTILLSRHIFKTYLPSFDNSEVYQLYNILPISLRITFDTLQGTLYILMFFALWKFKTVQKLLSPLKYAGKMALSNYFFQSVICVFIFYSYGLGFYGKLTPSQLVLLATVIFIFQLILSKIWLKFYQQGPLEILWKKLSYSPVKNPNAIPLTPKAKQPISKEDIFQ